MGPDFAPPDHGGATHEMTVPGGPAAAPVHGEARQRPAWPVSGLSGPRRLAPAHQRPTAGQRSTRPNGPRRDDPPWPVGASAGSEEQPSELPSRENHV